MKQPMILIMLNHQKSADSLCCCLQMEYPNFRCSKTTKFLGLSIVWNNLNVKLAITDVGKNQKELKNWYSKIKGLNDKTKILFTSNNLNDEELVSDLINTENPNKVDFLMMAETTPTIGEIKTKITKLLNM
ncbi:MAG: hypothetical protein V1684_01875 [bacterium]